MAQVVWRTYKMYMDALAGLLLAIMGLGGMAAVALMADALSNKGDNDDFTF